MSVGNNTGLMPLKFKILMKLCVGGE